MCTTQCVLTCLLSSLFSSHNFGRIIVVIFDINIIFKRNYVKMLHFKKTLAPSYQYPYTTDVCDNLGLCNQDLKFVHCHLL